MDNKTLTALRESIAHWDRMASGKRQKDEHIGVPDCALCALFWTWDKLGTDSPSCVKCPVMQRTGKKFCVGSPFDAASNIVNDHHGDEGYDTPEFREAAMRELEFLRSLLPEDHLTR